MLYKYIFWQNKNNKTNVGRNLIVLEDDILSSLSPLMKLCEFPYFLSRNVLLLSSEVTATTQTLIDVPERKLHFQLYDYDVLVLRHLQIFVFSCTITTKQTKKNIKSKNKQK